MNQNIVLDTLKNYALLEIEIAKIYKEWQELRIEITGGNYYWHDRTTKYPIYRWRTINDLIFVNEQLNQEGGSLEFPISWLWNPDWKAEAVIPLKKILGQMVLEKMQS
jgi:hypothetical protein